MIPFLFEIVLVFPFSIFHLAIESLFSPLVLKNILSSIKVTHLKISRNTNNYQNNFNLQLPRSTFGANP